MFSFVQARGRQHAHTGAKALALVQTSFRISGREDSQQEHTRAAGRGTRRAETIDDDGRI
jgi:hypothetical protein